MFLGVPGVVLALLVTLAVAASGSERRRREQALLRIRGASLLQVLRLAGSKLQRSASSALSPVLFCGCGGSGLVAPWRFSPCGALVRSCRRHWVYPRHRGLSHSSMEGRDRNDSGSSRANIQNGTPPLWQRLYADFVFLAIGAIVFWMVAKTGYQIVLAPEGVAQTSVHYEAFLAPLCLWVGAGLLWVRLSRLALGPGQGVVATVLRPMSAALAPIIAASLSRQQQRMAAGVALVALAFAFATATAIFNTTYNAQSRIDAELTNGADVTVTGTPAHPADALLQRLRAVPGVVTAEPMMHRFAYVGADLQDIFGINPARIGKVTTISNAYFANNNAAKILALLAETTGRRSCLAGDGERFSATTRRSFESAPSERE